MTRLHLSRPEARRFLLAHHRLWPPRQLSGKADILDFISHVGCIQYDPINVTGRNADLVLQARVRDYQEEMLAQLLYQDRLLLDGWDKVASIYAAGDWPYFQRFREQQRRRQAGEDYREVREMAPAVLAAVRQRGPLASTDLKENGKTTWSWGTEVRLVRAAMEILYDRGDLAIHSRLGSKRRFDLTERLLPAEVLAQPDPNESLAAYQEWHVLRRAGGLGLADLRGADKWLGISDTKSASRRAAVARLLAQEKLLAATIEGFEGYTFYLRAADLPTLAAAGAPAPPAPRAAFIGALDNLVWDRQLIELLFDFKYRWEVYKPAAQRQYGYYVLPVLYGDRFVARVEPVHERKQDWLLIRNWWWEEGVEIDEALRQAVADCLAAFQAFTGASDMVVAPAAASALDAA